MGEGQPRKRIKQLEVMVADVIEETHDTATLVLFTGNDHLEYKAGHFLTIDPHQFEGLDRFIDYFEDQKGKKRTAARVFDVLFTGRGASRCDRQRRALCEGPNQISAAAVAVVGQAHTRRHAHGDHRVYGPYTLDDDVESQTDHIVHVCAGSGSVPNFSILKFALINHPKLKHTFIYSNRTWGDVIFRRQLDELAQKHPNQLRVVHALTRETSDLAGAHKGRVNKELLQKVIPDPSSCLAYVCGPGISSWDRAAARANNTTPAPRFLESVLAELKETGVAEDRIVYESYG